MNKQLLIAAPLMSLLVVTTAFAQANYSESFEGVGSGEGFAGGPGPLISRGWVFRNQSRPAGTGISPYWAEFAGWGQAASALGHGGFATWQNNQSRISAWIVLPAIPNQQSGDPLKIWTSKPQDAFGNNLATLEIRYSPTGGTSTGSGENDVGNFTQTLMTVGGTTGHPWTERVMNLPGNGRIAFRLIIGPGASQQAFNGSILLDSLQVGNPPPPPYPMPGAGETVHWTLAHSPVNIVRNGQGQNPRIVQGGTVIVDPGVEVRFGSGAQLEVAGNLQLAGTLPSKVKLRGAGWARVLNTGTMTGSFADVQAFTDLVYGAKAAFTDCTFTDPSNPTGFSYNSAGDIGHRFFDGDLSYPRQILSLNRCTFGQGCDVALLRGWLAARNTTFYRGGQANVGNDPVGGEAMFVVGNAILDNVTVTEAYIDLMQDHHQHRYVGNVSVTGNPHGPGIRLEGGGNYLIDPNVTLQGNKWPVNFGFNSAGLLPGSRLPATGNQFNEIPGTDDPAPLDERVFWADAGIPYVITEPDTLHGEVTILPGVTVKIGENVPFFFDTDSNGGAMPIFLGEPERPILFTSYTPGTQWLSLPIGTTVWYGARWDWCIFENSHYGVSFNGMPLAIDNSIFRNNHRAVYNENHFAPRKCTFENNIFSITGERFAPNHEIRGFLNANHPANPNTFVDNNGVPNSDDFFNTFLPNGGLSARVTRNSLETSVSDVRNNWWGTTTGPHNPLLNPGGQGDEVFFGMWSDGRLTPFLTEAPTSNPPPVVRIQTSPGLIDPEKKLHLAWRARDDGQIVSQRIYYSPDSNIDSRMEMLAEVPPEARSFEWTVPNIGTPVNGADQYLRVVSVDDLGQEGIADMPFRIANPGTQPGTVSHVSPPAGTYRPGQPLDVCFTFTPAGGEIGQVYGAIELDNDEGGVSLGGQYPTAGMNCMVLDGQTPDVSTDRARIRYQSIATLNQIKTTYGPYFSIRPDPMLGDAAPTVSLTTDPTGQSFAGGTTVSLAWTAADDEALRSFDIRASLDGGVTWRIVARDLPADARAYTWRLPASQGVPDARVRIVAKDRRFQNTSAESGAFAITVGGWVPPCPADFDGDGFVTGLDYDLYVQAFESGETTADFDGDGFITGADFDLYVVAYEQGCP